LRKAFYLNLHNRAMLQLRQAANRHHRTVVIEATRILEEALRPGHAWENAAGDVPGAEKCNGNCLYVNLSEESLARLRPLAEKNYRSVAGEAAFVLEMVASLINDAVTPCADESAPAFGSQAAWTPSAATPSKPKLKPKVRKKPQRPKSTSNHRPL
jgi:hypothetical protein